MVKIKVDDLSPCIACATNLVNGKSIMPILSCVMMECKKDHTIITASDGETWLTMRLPSESDNDGFNICVDAQDVSKALANLKGKTLSIDVNDSKMVCNHGTGRFALTGQSVDDFPRVEKNETIATVILNAASLSTAINKSIIAAANDTLRPVMCGVHFDFVGNDIVSVASNGHQLIKYTINDAVVEASGETGLTLPRKPAGIIKNILSDIDDNVKMCIGERALTISNENMRMVTRLPEQRYPDYNRVIPTNNNNVAVVDKSEFLLALKRVAPMCTVSTEMVKVSISNDGIVLTGDDYDMGKKAQENVTCEYNGQSLLIGFKSSMLIALISNIDSDKVTISMNDAMHAVLFTDDSKSNTSLLMPMIIPT